MSWGWFDARTLGQVRCGFVDLLNDKHIVDGKDGSELERTVVAVIGVSL